MTRGSFIKVGSSFAGTCNNVSSGMETASRYETYFLSQPLGNHQEIC
jgi:hypothetical protein